MINLSQLRGFAGIDATGTEKYFNLNETFDQKVVSTEETVREFTLTAGATRLPLTTTIMPDTAVVAIDGSASFSLEGGIVLARTKEITIPSLLVNSLFYGANVVEIEGANLDDLEINLEGVYGVLTTDLADGDTFDATRVQLSFAKIESGSLVDYELPAGDYKFRFVNGYSIASAAYAGKLGQIISNGSGSNEGFTEQEVMDLLRGQESHWAEIRLKTIQTLGVNKTVTLEVDSAANTFTIKDENGVDLIGTKTNSANMRTNSIVLAGINGTLADSGIEVFYNGVACAVDKMKLVASNKILVAIDTASTDLYADDVISFRGL